MLRRTVLACLLLFGITWQSELCAQRLKTPFDHGTRYPRMSPFDYEHLRAELRIDFEKEEVHGRVTHRGKSRRADLKGVVLDAVDIAVKSVKSGKGAALKHRAFADRIEIDFSSPLGVGDEYSFVVEYHCRPKRGTYFRQAVKEYPKDARQVWTQGEAELTRHYIPCFDSPSERLTTELLIRVPKNMDVLSNGEYVGRAEHDDGTHTVHWHQKIP
ncbi:MAG: hypothetical protein AAF517_12115, partial [Planctomycetota bacterium]